MSDHWKPIDYPELSPYLMVHGAQKVIDFLVKVFDGTQLRRFDLPNGKIAHVEVRIGSSVVMMADGGPGFPASPAWLHLYVQDVDVSYRRALDAGASSVQAPQHKPDDPDRRGAILDPSGNTWWISSQVI
ncbi:MAG: VOC family protein [Gemmatimonadales bacterium]